MIVHAAGSHFAQGKMSHSERLFTGFALRIARVKSGKKIQRHWAREFRRRAKAALPRIITARDLFICGVENCWVDLALICCCRLRFTEGRDDLAALLDNLVVIFLPGCRDPFEHFFETRLTVAVLRWKVGSANERL